jgi:hypothetical protein
MKLFKNPALLLLYYITLYITLVSGIKLSAKKEASFNRYFN